MNGKLGELHQYVNLAYLAREYFDKPRSWFFRKIVDADEKELEELDFKKLRLSLLDISEKIKDIAMNLPDNNTN